MLRHRLCRAAWLLAPWRSQRDRLDFYHGLLGAPRWLGAITPLGGVLLIAGFVLFGWTALRF